MQKVFLFFKAIIYITDNEISQNLLRFRHAIPQKIPVYHKVGIEGPAP